MEPLRPNLIAFLFPIHILLLENFDHEHIEIGKEKKVKWPSFINNVLVEVENPKEFTKTIKPSK